MSCCGACGGQDNDKNKDLAEAEQKTVENNEDKQQEESVNTFTPE